MSLEQKTQMVPADRVYEEFEPPYDWAHEEASGTLILMLPGFKKEQLRVQIASTRILRLSGERQIRENKWRQFRMEFPIGPEFDTSGISAKFEGGMLYVKIPKLITPIKPQLPPTTTQLEPPKPPQQPTPQAPPNAQPGQQKPTIMDKASEAKAENTTQPRPPTPTPIPRPQEPKADEDSQKKPRLVDKAAETKPQKTKAPLREPKAVDDTQKEKGKSEATTSKTRGMHETTSPDHGLGKGEAKIEKRSQTLELLSRQTQDYKNALSGLVEELKKQKKLVNLLVVIFLVLVFVFYVKNAIKSAFEGPKSQEL